MAAAAGVGAALRLDQKQLTDALGIAGSMAGGIIEYLADGSWTKRMHPGWAAQSGLRAALLARAGFTGPRTVFEGTHGLFNAFAHTREGNWGALLDGFGERWLTETLAFKPYPCGNGWPYIDCARRLAADQGWRYRRDRLRGRRRHGAPAVGRSPTSSDRRLRRQFATPYCIAAAFLHGNLGLDAFTDAAVADPTVRTLAARCATRSIPPIPTPTPTPAASATLADGRTVEERQPICAAGRRRRCRARSWKRNSHSTPRGAAGGKRRWRPPWRWRSRCGKALSSILRTCGGKLKTQSGGCRMLVRYGTRGASWRHSANPQRKPRPAGGGRPIRSWGPSIP